MASETSDAQSIGGPDRIYVVVDGGDAAIRNIHLGKRLADAIDMSWEAIFPETPANRGLDDLAAEGEALALAARLGAMVHRAPAATIADAVAGHVAASSAPHIIVSVEPRPWFRRAASPSLIEELSSRIPQAIFHAAVGEAARAPIGSHFAAASARAYVVAALGAMATLGIGLLVEILTGTPYLSILFLFPVIAAAARLGFQPALLATVISAFGFNLLFLNPRSAFNPWAMQTWLMLVVLTAVAAYTAWLTGTLRGRVALSDRTAHESSTLAGFAQKLTRVADWTSTGEVVCAEVSALLGVDTMMVREIGGELQIIWSEPKGVALDPLDRTALEVAWRSREPAGSGTTTLGDTSWQFLPLVTSLGVLAVLGLARDDGRNPVPAAKELLLATMVAQAALAHERLRLEDDARERARRGALPR